MEQETKHLTVMKTLALLPLLLLCSCGPSSDLPTGFETLQMNDGWYLRSNGVSLMQLRYTTREEAKGQAWTWAGQLKHGDPNHIKVDAILSSELSTNQFTTNGQTHELVHRFVWVSFNIYNVPFKALVLDNVISDQLVPTNTFNLSVEKP